MRKSTIFGLVLGLGLSANAAFAADEVSYTLDPASGCTLDAISTVTLTFEAGANVGFYEGKPAVGTLENTTTGDVWYCENPMFKGRTEDGSMVYEFNWAELGSTTEVTITEVGAYELSIRGAYTTTISDAGEESEPVDLPVIVANYTIEYPVTYTLSPAEGKVDDLSTIKVTFDGKVRIDDSIRPAAVVLENTTTGDAYYCYTPLLSDTKNQEQSEYTLVFFEMGGEEPVEITEVGEYVLSIKGVYNEVKEEDGETVPASYLPVLTANYSIVYPVEYVLTPAANADVDALGPITLTFDGKVRIDDNVRPAPVVLENKTTGSLYYCYTPFLSDTKNQETSEYTLVFYEMGGEEPVTVTEVGDYVLTVRGIYNGVSTDEAGDEVYNYLPVLTVNYSIVYPVSYTLNPESGENLSAIDTIVVTFAPGENVGFADARPGVGVLENTTTGEYWYCQYPMFEGRDENGAMSYSFNFATLGSSDAEVITAQGDYIFSIHGLYTSTINEDGEESEPTYLPVLTAKYYINYPESYEFTPAAGSEVEDLSEIVLTFPNNPLVGVNEVRPAPVVLENLSTGDVWYCENPSKSYNEEGGAVFTMTFSELGSSETCTIDQVGTYLLTVKGLYSSVLDGDDQVDTDMPTITAEFYIVESAGVHGVINENSYNVYGINGVQVLRNAQPDALNNLPAGLYIINGKKVLIRK